MKQLLTIMLFLFGIVNFSLAQMKEDLRKEIEKIIYYDAKVSYEDTPGFVIGIIRGDSTFVYAYGSAEKGTAKTLHSNSIFELGGLSKVFAASLVELLVQEGKLDYEKSISEYLTEEQSNSLYAEKTILDLVAHTSGLPRMPMGFGIKEFEDNNPYAHYTKQDFLDFYSNYKLHPPKEVSYIYSNVGYALLQQIIENVCGDNYEAILEEKILAPIALDDTAIIAGLALQANLVNGYSYIGKPVAHWTYQSFEASTGIKSSTEDLLAFLNVHLGKKHSSLSAHFSNTHQTVLKTDIDNRTYVAKGWHIIKNKRYYDTLAHSGSTSGHRVFMGFVKETKTGVVVLSNSKKGTNGLGYLILKMLNNNWKKKKKSS